MIPEQFWSLAKRWYWLIGLFGAIGVAAGLTLIETGTMQPKSTAVGTTRVGVSRLLTLSGNVLQADASKDSGAVSDYATSLVEWSKSPQFLANVQRTLGDEDIRMTAQALTSSMSVARSGPLTISITARADRPQLASALADAGSRVIRDRAQADEANIRSGLEANLAQNLANLQARLKQVDQQLIARLGSTPQSAYRQSLDSLIAGGFIGSGDQVSLFQKIVSNLATTSADPELSLLQSQAAALQKQLDEVVATSSSLSYDLNKWPAPAVVVSPVETASVAIPGGFRKRDLLTLSLAGGLVAGWVAANLAERLQTRASAGRARSMAPAGLEEVSA